MVKKAAAPSGFYTAKEAMQRLGLPKGTFFYQVRTGKIKKTLRPDGVEGYYDRKMIDKMAQDKALFTLVHSIEPITFSRVESENDIRGIVDLCIAIYGQGGTPSYDARLEIWRKNNSVYWICKQEGIVVGYVSMIWFDPPALAALMGPSPKQTSITSAGTGIYSITGPEHVMPFTLGEPIESIFISMGVRPGLSLGEQREYGFKLLKGMQEVLINFAGQGMPVHYLHATSERGDGIRLARKLGMKEIRYPGEHILRYELDMETADHPLLQPYKDALTKWRETHN